MNDPKRRYDYVKKGEKFCDKADGLNDVYNRPTSPDWVGSGWYRVTGQAGTSLSTHAYQETWVSGSSNDGTCGTHLGSHVTGTHPSTVGQTGAMKICFNLSCNHSRKHDIVVTNCGSFYVYKLPGILRCSYRYCTQ